MKIAFFILITFTLTFNFFIQLIFYSNNKTENNYNDLFNLGFLNLAGKKNTLQTPNIPLNTLNSNDFNGSGNNRAATAFYNSNGTNDGNATHLIIGTNGWDMLSPNCTLYQLAAHNYTKNIEDQASFSYDISTNFYLMTFNISQDANLSEVKFFLRSQADNATILIYNSNASLFPNILYHKIEVSGFDAGLGAGTWINYSLSENNTLKINQTSNYTFFIGINRTFSTAQWRGNDVSIDKGSVYRLSGTNWLKELNKDMTLIITLSPLNETPSPMDINLKINGQNVLNNFTWKNSSRFNATGNNIIFDIDSSWDNISFTTNWTAIIIKNFNGITNFTINATQVTAFWNVSILNIGFEAKSSNKQINVSLPGDWNVSAVFNDSTQYGNIDIVTENGLKILRIFDPPNASWKINIESFNYINSIKIYNNTSEINSAIIQDNVKINGSLQNNCFNGNANLSIFLGINQKNTTHSAPNGNISFDIILDNTFGIVTNGSYRFQLTFNNGTEVGIKEIYLNIINNTYFDLISPNAQKTVFYSGEQLNIIINYTMLYWNGSVFIRQPIDNFTGGNVTFQLYDLTGNNWIPLAYNQSSKLWTITTLLSIEIGIYVIYINASKADTEYQQISRIINLINFNGTIQGTGDPRPINVRGYENGTNLQGNGSLIQVPTHGNNLTFSNFTLYDISSIIERTIEDTPVYNWYNITDRTYAMKFNISESCILQKLNFQLFFYEISNPKITFLNIYLWNASWTSQIEPDNIIWQTTRIANFVNGSLQYWYELTVPDINLNTNLTANNSFFLTINGTNFSGGIPYLVYTNDSVDNSDEGEAYNLTSGSWMLLPIDFWMKITLKEPKNPSQIALNILNIPVSDNPTLEYSGFWISTNTYPASGTGNVSLNVQSNQSMLSYFINYTIQYENSSIISSTKFTFNVTEISILWNITFLATLSNKAFNGTINITYPQSWNVSLIFSPDKLNYTNTEEISLGNLKYLIIKNFNSTRNGTWNLILYSNKFYSNIWIWNNTGTGYQQINSAFFTDIIKFNATVTYAKNGCGNISIFNPSNNLYNLRSLTTPSQDGNFDFSDWKIMDNLTTDGNNTVLFLWSNGTEVAGELAYLYVRNTSSLIVILPKFPELQGNIINGINGTTFNLTIYFNMSYWKNGWSSVPLNETSTTKITYQTNNLIIANPLIGNLTFIGNGTWSKIFNVPTTDAPYFVFINASSYDIRQSNINFTLIVANRSNLEITPQIQSVYWGETVKFSLNYTDLINGRPIPNATIYEINYTISSVNKSGVLIEAINYTINSLNGIYNITLISGTLSNYTYDLTFKIYAYKFQLQNKTGTLLVNNRTTSLTLAISPTPILLGDNASFILSYNDSLNYTGIIGASLKTNASSLIDISWTPVAGQQGKYNVTMNSSKYNNTGNYLLRFNASKGYYETAYIDVTVQISAFYTNLTPISGVNGTINNWKINVTLNSSYQIIVKYLNLWNLNPIGDALVDAYFEGHLLSSSELGNGNYLILLDTSLISNPTINLNYSLNITMQKNGFQLQSINITIKFVPLTTILTPIQSYINATHNDIISINVLLTDNNFQTIGPSYGVVKFYITNATGIKYKQGNLNYYSGYYRNDSVQLFSTELANGTYSIIVNYNSSYNFYFNSSCSIVLNFSVSTPIIPTIIEFINLPKIANESSYIDFMINLTNSEKTEVISGGLVDIVLIASFDDGSTLVNRTSTNTNDSGLIEISYLIPLESITISITANYYGSNQYEQSSNSTGIVVIREKILLTIITWPILFVPEGEPLSVFCLLENSSGPLTNKLIIMNIIITSSLGIYTLNFNFTSSSQGLVSLILPIPEKIFSVSVSATYYGTKGYKIEGSPRSVAILNQLEYFLRENYIPILLFVLVITLVIIGIVTYFKAVRPRSESLPAKKKRLMMQRAEMTKELDRIVAEIDRLRDTTLIQAQKAEQDGLFEEAAKAYERVGNLSLELAEKSIAKDYFARSRSLMKEITKEEVNKKREDERKKLVESARIALKERKIGEASKYYQKIVNLSIQLGDLKTAQKFSNLIVSTEDQLEMLKDQDLRTELKDILTKGDKAMGKQKFNEAAKHFEEASRLLILLNEPEGVKKFAEWAKLARERQEIYSESAKDWKSELLSTIEETYKVAEKKKEESDYDQVILNLLKIAIYYLELDDETNFQEYRQKAQGYSEKLKIFRTDRKAKTESTKIEILQRAEKAESEGNFNKAAELFEAIAKLAIELGDRYEAKQHMNKAQILLKQSKKFAETEELEKLEKPTKPLEIALKKEIKPTKIKSITGIPKPRLIKPIEKMVKPVKVPRIMPDKLTKPSAKIPKHEITELAELPEAIPEEIPPIMDDEKLKEIRNQIDDLTILIKDCQQNKRFNSAIYYYKIAANLSKKTGDKQLYDSYTLKIKELNTSIPKKIEPLKSRDKIKKLMDISEKNLGKKDFSKVIENYKDIAELFFLIKEEDAAIDFLDKIKELKK